ncbi:hypothetical protein niasHS_005018 [Heterodera schachtii]|uniref:RRM domain-containing protein n=1 Tax=Heterodera schachtii TaxID=97005 RepID=A0ABD2JKA9_HETSC
MLFLFRSFLHTYQNNRSQILFLKPNCFYCETSNQHNSSFLKRCIVVVVEESTKGMFRRVRRGLGLKKFLVFRSSAFRKCVAPIMYIAVRVDSKAAARKVMENFSTDGELLGIKVEMTWFRDIRRYLAHCAKQGSRPSRFRGRSDYRRDDEQYKGRGRSSEFFEKDFGACTFDFVKVSPDRTKLYIAVLFDSKAAASKVMEIFSTDGELLGFKVEMTWFRDIRRYLAHCAKQGIRPSRFRGRSDYRRMTNSTKGAGVQGKSPTRSPDREEGARSRSASAASRHSNANRRRSQSRSHSARSHSHSRSLSSGGEVRAARDGNASHSEREKSFDYSDIEEAYFEFLFFTFISLIYVEESSSFAATRSVALSAAPKKVEEREAKEGEAAAPQQAPPSLADHRHPHSGSDMEMGGEEEDGLSNGGGRKMLKMESSSPVNNSKAFSPPKFKPIGELSDYQQQINGSQVSNIRFAAPPPQPPPVLRNVPLPPVTTNNNEMMVDRTCRNNTAKPSASDFGLAG